MLLTELSARITSQSLVNTGYTVFTGYLPPSPHLAIALYETGGTGMERFFGGSAPVDRAGLQVVVRGAPQDYATPRRQMEKLYQGLSDWTAFTQSGVRYLNFVPLQSPFVFNRDETERVVFAVNFLVWKELSPVNS